MKRMAFAVGLVVLVFGVMILAQTQTESVEQELLKLEQGWTEANIKGDADYLEGILADEFTLIDEDGVLWTKPQYVGVFKSREIVISSMVSDDTKVRVYGNTAVVTGRNTVTATLKGKGHSGQERWTDTWIKLDGRWKCVATHNSTIAQK